MSDTNIVLRFVSGGGWDSHMIEYWTQCEWSHVECVLNGRTYGAMFKGGVKWREFGDPEYNRARRTKLVEVPSTAQESAAYWKFLLAQEGKPYDSKAIVSFGPILRLVVKDRNWRDDSKWFCSELQMAALESAGKVVIPDDTVITSYAPVHAWMVISQKCKI